MAAAVKGIIALGEGVAGLVGAAGTAVKVTAEVAQKAVDATGAVTGAAVDAAGVLGTATLDATRIIGKAGLETTTAVAQSGLQITTKAAETTAAIAQSGLKLAEKTADTAVEVGSAALDAASVSSKAVLETTGVTVKAATDVLKSGVRAGATLVTTSLNGFTELNKRVAARGALIAKRWEGQQTAEAKALQIADRKEEGKKADAEFNPLADQLRGGVKQLVAVQNTTLAANINMYRLVKCTWWKRTFGNCEVDTIKADTRSAKLLVNQFLQTIDRQKSLTSIALLAGKDAAPLIESYMQVVDAASIKFETAFTTLSDKYIKLADDAINMPPPPTAGRRRKAKPSSQRTRRAVRGRRASRRGTRKGIRGT